MITYLEINLFDSPAQTLVNTVNTVGVMGKGIASTFKQIYPQMFKEYRRLCIEGKFSVGMLYIYRTPNKIIVNFPTKKNWKYPSSAEYIRSGLEKFVANYQKFGISSVSFPQLGCGHGELDWESQVHPLMKKYLGDLPIPVYIHIYNQTNGFIPERFDSEYAHQVQLERKRISGTQLWQDLFELVMIGDAPLYQLSLFGPRVRIENDSIHFNLLTDETKLVLREDIEDLWKILRVRGTIDESDFPISIRNNGTSEFLVELLGRLDYIKPIQLKSRNNKNFITGLQYDPQPDIRIPDQVKIVI